MTTESSPENRMFQATLTEILLFSHPGNDADAAVYARDFLIFAIDGILGQHPELHLSGTEIEVRALEAKAIVLSEVSFSVGDTSSRPADQ